MKNPRASPNTRGSIRITSGIEVGKKFMSAYLTKAGAPMLTRRPYFPRPSSRQRAQLSPHNPLELAHELRLPRRPARLQAFAGPRYDRLVTAGGEIGTPSGDGPAHRAAPPPG